MWGEPPASTSGWTSSVGSNYVNTCGSETIIGGYGKFEVGSWAEKTYSGLPGHNTISIQWDAYFLDSWDGTNIVSDPSQDSYELLVDGTSQYNLLYSASQYSTSDICGDNLSEDWITTVNIGPFSHNSSVITLRFITGLDESSTDESFGFKNIKITVDVICAPACATCFGNDISQCNSCKNGWYLSGTTCVADCGAHFWNDPTGNICSGNNFIFFNICA